MTYKIQGEMPFQVLASNFSIGPSNEGYTLQISADGTNYSDLFAVGANVTRMVTGVANGSYYRLSGNDSQVAINWIKQCNDGGSGGGEGTGPQGPMGPQGIVGPQGPQGPAGEGGEGGGNVLHSVDDFPQDPADGDVINFDGILYKYSEDAEGWEEVEAVGPAKVLWHMEEAELEVKKEEGDVSNGDVYAIHRDATERVIGNSWNKIDLTETYWDRDGGNNPQAIRISATIDGSVSIGFACNDYDSSTEVYIDNGVLTVDRTDVWVMVSENEWKFVESAWVDDRTDGDTIYIEYDGDYIYAYSTGSKIWLYNVQNNNIGGNIETGEITPATSESNDVYQVVSVEKPLVEVFGEGNYINEIASNDQFVISYGGTMVIKINDVQSFIDMMNADEVESWTICNYESWSVYAPLAFTTGGTWDFYDDNNVIIESVGDGDSGTLYAFDGQQIDYSFSNGELRISMYTDKGWQLWDIPEETVVVSADEKLLKEKDLPTGALLPETASESDIPIYSSDAWRLTNRGAIIVDGMRDAYSYDETEANGQPYALHRTDYWGVEWAPTFKMVKLSQQDYDDMQEHDENTIYIIVEENQGA